MKYVLFCKKDAMNFDILQFYCIFAKQKQNVSF